MSNELKFNGVILEKEDPRNYTIARFIPKKDKVLDKEFMLNMPELQVILDQGYIGSCVAHAYTLCKQILEYQRTNKWIEFSPMMLYGTRYEEDRHYDSGMYSYTGAKVLMREGAFYKKDFNLQKEMPALRSYVEDYKKSNSSKVKEALNYTIEGYSYMKNTEDMKTALKNGMPIAASYALYSSFYDVGRSGRVSIPKKSESLEGYHCMCIVGWTKNNEWIVLNSWGVRYGFKGVYYIPFDYAWETAIAVSDTISPIKSKAKHIELEVGKSKYLVDGETKELDSEPYIKDDRTFLPVRFVSEALGASVEWNHDSKEVIIRSEESIIKMKIGSSTIYVNDKKQTIDCKPEIINNRTMLPVRFISEYLNCKVTWDSGKVIIDCL